ncbi:hypothetical protein CKALI_09595 [Corynebacterium kalinowskii]|uniref:Uncharacterized protein n=1 Tax=Corynebacterium kalinowskii TaxID=2675216 RepID=A0A6B8VMX9_9CORY|nr:hypothetical protein CKALI_09595 [Corynebacterium kalinowskii]
MWRIYELTTRTEKLPLSESIFGSDLLRKMLIQVPAVASFTYDVSRMCSGNPIDGTE